MYKTATLKSAILIGTILISATVFILVPAFLNKQKLTEASSRIKIVFQTGEVTYKESPTSSLKILSEDLELVNLYQIKTSNTGKIHLLFPNNSLLTVESNTDLDILSHTQALTSVDQKSGKVWYRLAKVDNPKSDRLYVNTKKGKASARGTEFGVVVNEQGNTDVIVASGLVATSGQKNSAEVLISSEQFLTVDNDCCLEKVPQIIPEYYLNSEFIINNLELTKTYFDENLDIASPLSDLKNTPKSNIADQVSPQNQDTSIQPSQSQNELQPSTENNPPFPDKATNPETKEISKIEESNDKSKENNPGQGEPNKNNNSQKPNTPPGLENKPKKGNGPKGQEKE